uniref:Uncharacterized protein n=1 Tax=Xiphophorus maculatus TaxID=8083 RepID=A0A3B5Q0N3_XIPMA
VAEDHCLCNSQTPIQVTERCELVLLLPAEHIELLDCVQRLLFSFQSDYIRIGNHSLGKLHYRVLKRCREQQHLTVFVEQKPPVDPDALVPMTLHGDHHISFIQHKHCDLLWVNKLVLGAPVKDGAWGSNDNLLLQLDMSPFQDLTSVPSNGVGQFHIWTKFAHLFDHLADLQRELVRWQLLNGLSIYAFN